MVVGVGDRRIEGLSKQTDKKTFTWSCTATLLKWSSCKSSEMFMMQQGSLVLGVFALKTPPQVWNLRRSPSNLRAANVI